MLSTSTSWLVLTLCWIASTEAGRLAAPRMIRCRKLLPVGNQGGFRVAGSTMKDSVKLAVLYTTGSEPDWPDALDPYTGTFTYYGDNRRPGRALEGTPSRGNLLLSRVFARAHGDAAARVKVPPFLLFDKPGTGRDVRFRGLLAPGSDRLSGEEDLVAVWRTTGGVRFQNYQARFTVLDTPSVTRAWIDELVAGRPLGSACPAAWRAWAERGHVCAAARAAHGHRPAPR